MNHESYSAPWPFPVGVNLALNPRHFSQAPHGWDVSVSAVELAGLAQGPDAVRALGARRGFLGETPANLELRRTLAERPEHFGRIHPIVLGADEVHVPGLAAARGGVGALHVYGVECIDGLQRLCTVADGLDRWGPAHLDRATVRLEIHCGRARDVARDLHDAAYRHVNVPTAQDRLVRCPNIQRLMRSDWEKEGSFSPWRGASAGPSKRLYTMPVVTRGLACLSAGPGPEAAHLAATDEGLEVLWGSVGSALYLEIFHDRMSPLGVVRAVDAYEAAQAALRRLPARARERAGHLISYAPDLVAREACRKTLPVAGLHDEQSRFDWQGRIERDLPAEVERTAADLVRRYEAVHARLGGKHYKGEVERLDVWRAILAEG
ncbi:hypothetical protein [Streptomyces sp.]|uniref:hypothetical protein n=1 Tax=Streptomyces sp. TaxID=1931 RepID=UPI0028122821|nr:hypothetical protein [Streptomyces sp.]